MSTFSHEYPPQWLSCEEIWEVCPLKKPGKTLFKNIYQPGISIYQPIPVFAKSFVDFSAQNRPPFQLVSETRSLNPCRFSLSWAVEPPPYPMKPATKAPRVSETMPSPLVMGRTAIIHGNCLYHLLWMLPRDLAKLDTGHSQRGRIFCMLFTTSSCVSF